MLFLIIKGILGSILFVGLYGFIGNILNFPFFYLWYDRRTTFLNNLSYFFLLLYSLICFYILGIYFATFSEALNLYSNRFVSILIPFVIVSIIGGHLLNQSNLMRELAIKADNDYRVRLTLLDVYDYKNKQYLMIMTKYGYILWAIYILFVIFSNKLNSLSFGFSEFLLKHILK
jgi:hypothetical protein